MKHLLLGAFRIGCCKTNGKGRWTDADGVRLKLTDKELARVDNQRRNEKWG